ncbi:uncharacterized protein LOC132204410 isoform X2 [Neocloeon triangulifer]|nr:uncharacterized protein LOC132204410 isoform X2 [Neocloeon triangulifer]
MTSSTKRNSSLNTVTVHPTTTPTDAEIGAVNNVTDVPVDNFIPTSVQLKSEETSSKSVMESSSAIFSTESTGLAVTNSSPDTEITTSSDIFNTTETHPPIAQITDQNKLLTETLQPSTTADQNSKKNASETSINSSDIGSTTMSDHTSSPSITLRVTKKAATTSTDSKNACEASRCEQLNFNISTNNALQVQSKGKVIVRSGKTYLMMSSNESQAQAASNCYSGNMSLVAIQELQKITFIQQMLKDLNISQIWTVGSNEGNDSCLNYDLKFAWCPTNVDIPAVILDKVNGSSLADLAQKALALVSDGSVANLLAIPSITKLPYLCELNYIKIVSRDTCSPLATLKNTSLFDENGKLKDGERYGNWMTICNKRYLFSNKLGTWQQNWDTCCSLGMRPVWFQDASDMACLSNATKSNWTLNYNYWTAGRAQGSWGQWAFCAPHGPLTLPDSLSWAAGQPDNASPDELCLHMLFGKNGANLTLSDRNCSHKYVIACQGITNLRTLCNKPSCPSTCEKNKKLFSDNILTDLFVHGQWNTGCGKEYLFSSKSMIWAEAWSYCCSVGMKLVSIEALNELQCMTNMVAKYPAAVYPYQTGRDFWTSGTNTGCPGPHFWCSENDKLLKEEIVNWKDGKLPTESAEMCIFLNLSNKTVSGTYLGEESCNVEKPFICETLPAATKSLQIKNTCQQIWKVTDLEIQMYIMNKAGDVRTRPRNLKCYIRCCGKKGEMIQHGSIVSDQILRGLEELSASNESEMQSAFVGFDSCSTIKRNDECVTMAEIFQCGKNTSPNLTLGLVTLNEGSATVIKSATGGINTQLRVCPKFSSCVPNVTQIQELNTTGKLPTGGVLITSSTGKKYYVVYVPVMTWAQSQTLCCELGGNLAIFETLADFNAFMKILPALTGKWAYIGPTFDNGDGTDSWCSTFKRLPDGVIANTSLFYRNQKVANQIYLDNNKAIINGVINANFVLCGPLPY